MMRLLRDFRILPVVLLAAAALLVLKSAGLLFDGGFIFSADDADLVTTSSISAPEGGPDPVVMGSVKPPAESGPAAPEPGVSVETAAAAAAADNKQSWAQEMFNFPDVTGSVGSTEKKTPPESGATAAMSPHTHKQAAVAPRESLGQADAQPVSSSERAILERLQQRREQIEARARELDLRENLIKAAEKRLQGRVNELKSIETRIHAAKTEKQEAENARFKGLVTMYENMKAKDAARIFDRLSMKVLIEVASQINPRRMADILAQMTPEAAERLTIEFASRATGEKAPAPTDLPKIQGRPNNS